VLCDAVFTVLADMFNHTPTINVHNDDDDLPPGEKLCL